MSYSVQTAVSDGTLNRVVLGIEFIDIAHIHVYRSDTVPELVAGTDFTWDGIIAVNLVSVVPNGVTVTILRKTVFDDVLNVLAGGAPFLRVSIDENFKQLLYIAQETVESGVTLDYYRSINMHGNRINNLGTPTVSTDAVPRSYVDSVTGALDTRLDALEGSVVKGVADWSAPATAGQTVISPPYSISNCILAIDGVVQIPGVDYTVASSVITLSGWSLLAGQRIHVRVETV